MIDIPLASLQPLLIVLAGLAINILLCRERLMNRTFAVPNAMTGRAIDLLERRYNRPESTDAMRKSDGISTVAFLILCAVIVGVLVHWGLAMLPYGWVVEALIITTILVTRVHLDQSNVLETALGRSLEEGRATLALIAARDSACLDEAGVARAGIETSAKTLAEGVVAPIFWYAVLGLPGLLAYKVINTSNHMIDERTPYSACFGWAAGKLNHIVLWPTSRVTGIVVLAASLLTPRARAGGALRTLVRESGRYMDARNAWPVAAYAGALGVKLGGPVCYQYNQIDGAWIGDGERFPDAADVRRARVLFVVSCMLVALLLAGVASWQLDAPLPF